MGEMLPFLMLMIQQSDSQNGDSDGQGDNTSGTMKFLEEKLKMGEVVDTVMAFSDVLQDELEKKDITKEEFMEQLAEDEDEESEAVKQFVENAWSSKFHLQVDPSKDLLSMTIIQPFSHVDSMLFSNLGDLMNLTGQDRFTNQSPSDMNSIENLIGNTAKYKLKKKCLIVTREHLKKPKEGSDEADMLGSLMKQSTYRMILHLPGKIKKVNNPNASFKGNPLTFELPYEELYNPDSKLDMEVKFKPNKNIRYED